MFVNKINCSHLRLTLSKFWSLSCWKDHHTNQSILDEFQPNRRLLNEVKRQKLQYFGHIARAQGLPTSVLHGYIDCSSSRGRRRRRWTDDIKDWTRVSVPACCSQAQDRQACRSLVSSFRPSVMRMDKERDRKRESLYDNYLRLTLSNPKLWSMSLYQSADSARKCLLNCFWTCSNLSVSHCPILDCFVG